MKSTDDIIARARREFDSGRPWRAKEILGGNIASGRLEPEILEEFGRVLDSMGDRIEAGKYLLLSGARHPTYAEAIELFKRRHRKRNGQDLWHQLPSALRGTSFQRLPEAVRLELSELGIAPELFAPSFQIQPVRDRITLFVLGVLMLLVLVALVIGFRQMGAWVWNAIH